MTENLEESKEFESNLLPILREGIDVVKMILFKELKDHFVSRYPDRSSEAPRLAGAVLNVFFGTVSPDPAYAAFMEQNQAMIDTVIAEFPSRFEKFLIPLTDALRMQFLCDSREGIDDSADFLAVCKERGVLLDDRDLPLPHNFLFLVRRLGSAYGLIIAPVPEESAGQDQKSH